ncbi:hypothetical protein TSUD_81660 [Trifolium subterraneum]|uniref:Uncharacterized protein n=1 Tax=Trifolium subterraneum TaxID=3900 RepID=A0A2Z6LV31_TRISU|nr:hypothetical protein TSUD_81660 [Trifolium subterraneum]
MKTLTGRCESSKAISLSKATKIFSNFVSADNGASQAINAYLHRASAAFNELNQLHKELKPSQSRRKNRQSQTVDDSGRVVESSVRNSSVDVKFENEFPNVDVKFKQEINGSVVSGSEKRDKKDRKKKIEFGDSVGDGNGNVPKKEQSGIELGRGGEGGTEEGKKQKKEKKDKKDKNLEVENVKEQEQQKEMEKKISNDLKVENGGLVAPQDFEIRSKMRNETGSEKLKLQRDENSEVENAKGQEQQKEVEKKLSNGVKSENGGSIGSQDTEIRSKKKHKAGAESKLDGEEVSTEKRKKRKNQDLEEKSEERSGERSKKKMKRKHEG